MCDRTRPIYSCILKEYEVRLHVSLVSGHCDQQVQELKELRAPIARVGSTVYWRPEEVC